MKTIKFISALSAALFVLFFVQGAGAGQQAEKYYGKCTSDGILSKLKPPYDTRGLIAEDVQRQCCEFAEAYNTFPNNNDSTLYRRPGTIKIMEEFQCGCFYKIPLSGYEKTVSSIDGKANPIAYENCMNFSAPPPKTPPPPEPPKTGPEECPLKKEEIAAKKAALQQLESQVGTEISKAQDLKKNFKADSNILKNNPDAIVLTIERLMNVKGKWEDILGEIEGLKEKIKGEIKEWYKQKIALNIMTLEMNFAIEGGAEGAAAQMIKINPQSGSSKPGAPAAFPQTSVEGQNLLKAYKKAKEDKGSGPDVEKAKKELLEFLKEKLKKDLETERDAEILKALDKIDKKNEALVTKANKNIEELSDLIKNLKTEYNTAQDNLLSLDPIINNNITAAEGYIQDLKNNILPKITALLQNPCPKEEVPTLSQLITSSYNSLSAHLSPATNSPDKNDKADGKWDPPSDTTQGGTGTDGSTPTPIKEETAAEKCVNPPALERKAAIQSALLGVVALESEARGLLNKKTAEGKKMPIPKPYPKGEEPKSPPPTFDDYFDQVLGINKKESNEEGPRDKMIKEQEKIDKAQKELDEIKRKYAKEQENFDKAKNALDKAQNDEIESKKSLKQAEMALRNVKEGVWKKGYDLASTGENYKNAKNAYKENPTSEALNKQEETLQIFKKARDEQVNQIKLTEQQKEREESAVKDAKNSSITALRDKNNAYQALQKAKGKLDLAQEKKAQKAKDEAIAEQDKIKQKAQKEYDKLKKEYEKYEAIEKEKEELARINKDIKTINGALAAYKAYREKHEPLSKKTCPPLPDPLPPSVPKLLNPPPPKPAEPEKKPQKPANTGEGEAAGSGTGVSPPEQGTSGGGAEKKEPCPNQDQREDLQDAIKKIADELKTALFDLPTQQGGRKRELEERKKRAGKSSGEQSSQTGPMFDAEVKALSETVDNLNQSLLSKETATSSSSDLLSKLNDAMVSFAKSSVVIDKALSDKDKATGDPALALQSAKAKLQELWNLLSAEWEKIHKDCQEQGALTPPSLEDSTQREGPSGDTTSPTGTSGGEAVKKEPCPSIGDRLALEKAREEIQKLGEAFNKKLAFDIFDIDEIKERDINKIDETIAGIQRAQDENIKGYRKTKDQRFIDEVKKQASLIENEKAKKEKILQVSEVAKAYSNAIKELEQAVSDSSLSIFEQYVAFKKYDENEKNIVDALRKAAALVDETWLTLHDKLQEETYKQLELLKTYRAALMKCPEIENLLLPPTPPSTEGPEGVSAGEQTPAPLTRVEVPQEKDLIQKILDKTLALFGKKPTEPKKIICEIPSIDICSSKASKEEMVKQYQDYLKKAPPECSSYIKEELEKKKEALEKEAKGKQEEKVN